MPYLTISLKNKVNSATALLSPNSSKLSPSSTAFLYALRSKSIESSKIISPKSRSAILDSTNSRKSAISWLKNGLVESLLQGINPSKFSLLSFAHSKISSILSITIYC